MAIDWDKIEKQIGHQKGINWSAVERQIKPATITPKPKSEIKAEPTPLPKKGVFESAFDTENYVDKFKRGDIKGGLANIAGSTLLASQSAYLNLLDAAHALAHREKPEFKHNLSGLEFQKSVAGRTGSKTLSEQLHGIHPAVGAVGDIAYEIGTDPIELTPLGFYKDIQKVKAGSEVTRGYMEAMMKGQLTPRKIADVTMSNEVRRGLKGGKATLKQPQVFNTELERLAYESNVKRGKLTPRGDILYGNAPQPIAGELPAPAKIAEPQALKTEKFYSNKGYEKIKGYEIEHIPETSFMDETFVKTPTIQDVDIRNMKAVIKEAQNMGVDAKVAMQELMNAYQAAIDEQTANAVKYFTDYKGKGVDYVPIFEDYGFGMLGEGRKYRGSLNDDWYSELYKRMGRTPTKAAKESEAYRLIEQEILNPHNYNRWIDPDVARKYNAVKKIDGIMQARGDGLIDIVRNADDTITFTTGQAREIVKPQYELAKGLKEAPFTATKGEMAKTFQPVAPNVQRRALAKPTTPALPQKVQTAETFIGGGKRANVVKRQLRQADGVILHSPPKSTKPLPEKAKRVFKEFRHRFEDDNILAMYEELRAKGLKDLPDADQSLYKTMRLQAGAPAKGDYRIQQYLAPALDEYRKAGGKVEDLSKYATAVHAQDVNRAGITSGLSNRQISEYISKYGTPEAEKARLALVKYSDDMIQDLFEAGRITKESLDGMRFKWKNYVPLQRDLGEDVALAMLKGDGAPIHELKGSKKAIIDPIKSMIENTYKIEASITKGDVDKQLIALAKKDITGGDVIRKLGKGESTDYKNIIQVMDNGKEVDYVVSNDLYRALTDFDKETNSWIVNMMSKPASMLRAGAVLNPEFALRNPIRDVLQAFINSESGFNPLTDFISGIYSYTKQDKHFHDFIKSGGAFGTVADVDRVAWMDMQRRVLADKGSIGKFVNIITPDNIMNMLRQMTEYSEMGTRMGEFKKAVKGGATAKEAAYRARDLQDFMRVGVNIRTPNRMVAFLNAEIQGISKFARALKRDPVKTSARAFTLLAGTSTAAYGFNHYFANETQKRTINDAPRWLRDTFWLIAIPGTDTVARIPKPFEGGFISNIVENVYDYLSGNNPEAFAEYFDEMKDNASLPSLISTFGPTGLLPIYEIASNKDYFRDAPVVSQSYQNLPKREQKDFRTSAVAKGVSAVAGKVSDDWFLASPMEVDHMIKGYTAGLGAYATGVVDIIVGAVSPETGTKAKAHWSQYPAIKGFTVNPYSSGKSSDKIYSESERLTQERNVRELSLEESSMYYYLNDVKKDLSELNKEIRELQNAPMLDRKAKRDKLMALTSERNKLTYDSAQRMKEIEEVASRLSKRYKDPDVLHREINRQVFGPEYALKKYNKAVYEKAQTSGISYPKFYTAYFAQKDYDTSLEKAFALHKKGIDDIKTYETFGLENMTERAKLLDNFTVEEVSRMSEKTREFKTDIEKAYVLLDETNDPKVFEAFGISPTAKEGYVSAVTKAKQLKASGISASEYTDAKAKSDINGNGNISKNEAITYLNTRRDLNRQQKHAMLQALVPNLAERNNPY